MKKGVTIWLLALLLVVMASLISGAEVEGDIQRLLKLQDAPVDVAVSLSGKWIFVLTQAGSVQIYNPGGQLEGQLSVGRQVDGIRVGPREDLLLLTSRAEKTVQILTLDFIRPINVTGSPFKGPEDAPVVIAVFSDFE